MKAAVCRNFGSPLQIESITIDDPGPSEVRVQVKACGICHSDIHAMNGDWGGTLPAIYGHEVAGYVESVGSGVTHLSPGDRVIATLLRFCDDCFYCRNNARHLCAGTFALESQHRLHDGNGIDVAQGLRTGGFAESIVVEQSQVVPVSDRVPFASSALIGCAVLTGWGAVMNTAQMPAGASAVVIGLGGVGLNTLQSAAIADADPLIAIDPAPEKRVAAPEFGATHALDPNKVNVLDEIRALTGGRGADYVFVTVGKAAVIAQGLTLLRSSGTLVSIGMPASGEQLFLEAADVAEREQRILGSKMGAAYAERDMPPIIELYKNGRFLLDELVSRTYPLEEINEAVASVKQSAARRNVIEL